MTIDESINYEGSHSLFVIVHSCRVPVFNSAGVVWLDSGTLRQLCSVRRPLSHDLFARLVAELVLSKMDYCTGVLAGLTIYPTKKVAVCPSCCSSVDLWRPVDVTT